jgi:hypothetical protein
MFEDICGNIRSTFGAVENKHEDGRYQHSYAVDNVNCDVKYNGVKEEDL